MNLSKNVKTIVVMSNQTASTGTKKGEILDMQGVSGVQLVAVLNSGTDGSNVRLKVAQSDTNVTGDMKVLSGSVDAPTATSGNINGKALILDLYKPSKRYIEPQLEISDANCSVSCILAITYESRQSPEELHDSILSDGLIISPEEA